MRRHPNKSTTQNKQFLKNCRNANGRARGRENKQESYWARYGILPKKQRVELELDHPGASENFFSYWPVPRPWQRATYHVHSCFPSFVRASGIFLRLNPLSVSHPSAQREGAAEFASSGSSVSRLFSGGYDRRGRSCLPAALPGISTAVITWPETSVAKRFHPIGI